jgi:hypothetical protein
MLEQPRRTDRSLPLGFYASQRVPQGYTQRGEVIGAATGPGSSSQWMAADLSVRRWNVGLEGERIRWDDDAYYATSPTGFKYFTHDVSLSGGASLAHVSDSRTIRVRLMRSLRINYQNQSANSGWWWDRAFDVRNTTLRVESSLRR